MFVEYCIDEINDMLFAAYVHGGDVGGPYGCDPVWMEETINNFLKHTGLDETYEYTQIDREHYFKVPQIVKKPIDPSKNGYSWS